MSNEKLLKGMADFLRMNGYDVERREEFKTQQNTNTELECNDDGESAELQPETEDKPFTSEF